MCTTRNCKHCTFPLEASWPRGISNSDNDFQSWIVCPCKITQAPNNDSGFQSFCLGWLHVLHVQHALSAQVCHVKHYPPRPAKYASFETLVRHDRDAMRCKILANSMTRRHACLFKMWETDDNDDTPTYINVYAIYASTYMAADQNLKARSIPRTHGRSIPHDPYPWSIPL